MWDGWLICWDVLGCVGWFSKQGPLKEAKRLVHRFGLDNIPQPRRIFGKYSLAAHPAQDWQKEGRID